MKKNALKTTIALACAFSMYQESYGQLWNPPWPVVNNWVSPLPPTPFGTGNSQPAIDRATPWALGGNSMMGIGPYLMQIQNQDDNSNPQNGNDFKSASIGTVDDAPFILKANNYESIVIDPGGQVGLGKFNSNPSAPVDIWTSDNSPNNNSRLRIFADVPGNIESDRSMSLIFNTNATDAFHVRDGNINSSTARFSIIQGGKCGINNSSPATALDVRQSGGSTSTRLYGDLAGNIESAGFMNLSYIHDFAINHGAVGSSTQRILLNSFGAHINANGLFQGLFIGPTSSPWYNNSSSVRLWLDALTNDGLDIVSGGGNNAMYIANSAGAPRMAIKVASGGGDDTKFDFRGSAQFGFYQSGSPFEDVNARVNVAALGAGVKITTNNNSTNAFLIQNSNFSSNPFVVFGTGRLDINQITGGVGQAEMNINTNSTNAIDVFNGSAVQFRVKSSGFVFCRELQVMTGAFPDYVFEKDYNLMPLNEVEKFITENKHLPGFENGESYVTNGIKTSEMFVKQQEKIEELMLYVIELKKEVEALKSK